MALGQAMDPRYVRQFALAGNAILTIKSKVSGDHYTYRIRHEENDRSEVWFVGVLAGPDNTSDYTYLGIIRDDQFRVTKKSKQHTNSPTRKAFQWMWERLAARRFDMLDDLEIFHSGQCSRCSRLLTDPESVSRGIGPVCRKKLKI